MENFFESLQKPIALGGRVLLGLYFIIPGITKVTGFAGMEKSHEMQNFIKNMAIMAGLMYVAGTPTGDKA